MQEHVCVRLFSFSEKPGRERTVSPFFFKRSGRRKSRHAAAQSQRDGRFIAVSTSDDEHWQGTAGEPGGFAGELARPLPVRSNDRETTGQRVGAHIRDPLAPKEMRALCDEKAKDGEPRAMPGARAHASSSRVRVPACADAVFVTGTQASLACTLASGARGFSGPKPRGPRPSAENPRTSRRPTPAARARAGARAARAA